MKSLIAGALALAAPVATAQSIDAYLKMPATLESVVLEPTASYQAGPLSGFSFADIPTDGSWWYAQHDFTTPIEEGLALKARIVQDNEPISRAGLGVQHGRAIGNTWLQAAFNPVQITPQGLQPEIRADYFIEAYAGPLRIQHFGEVALGSTTGWTYGELDIAWPLKTPIGEIAPSYSPTLGDHLTHRIALTWKP